MVREETRQQGEAFEAYYGMGADRSLEKMYQHYMRIVPDSSKAPAISTLRNWSRFYQWQERIAIKDKAIAEGIDKKTTKEAIDRRAKWLCQIEDRISSAFDKDGKPKFDVKGFKDLNETIRLALLLLGEPDEHKEVEHTHKHEIAIIEVTEQKRKD